MICQIWKNSNNNKSAEKVHCSRGDFQKCPITLNPCCSIDSLAANFGAPFAQVNATKSIAFTLGEGGNQQILTFRHQ